MKTPILTLAVAISLLCAGLAHAEPQALTIAVLGFESSDDKQKGKAAEAAELLAVHLGTKPELWLVERSEIDKILGEQTIGLSGLTDSASAVKVGQLLGAKALITGRLIKTGDRTLLVAKLMSTETSRVFGETAYASEDFSAAAAELADKIAATLASQRTAFEPKVVTREERVAALRETVKGNNQSVLVRIEERDLGRPVIDPAAQTEFEKTLLELGFAIFDPAQTGNPDIRIIGEAFSEPGARRGQLVSSRARVEIKVTAADGSVLAVDRQTATAVDIAESTAGKTALQNAAMDLVERVTPKLVTQ